MSQPNGLVEPAATHRRNSIVEIRAHGVVQRVHKRYLRTHDVDSERRAYALLREILPAGGAIGLPALHDADAAPGELVMDYVPGPTLAERLGAGDIAPLQRHAPAIVGLLAAARERRLSFDCDPANLIVSGERLVLIDPVALPLPLAHQPAAIFLHGLIKAALRCALRRPPALPRLRDAARRVFAEYCAATGAGAGEVLANLADYQTAVIAWNLEPAPGESPGLRLFRRLVLVPAYWLIRALVRQRARVQPRSQ